MCRLFFCKNKLLKLFIDEETSYQLSLIEIQQILLRNDLKYHANLVKELIQLIKDKEYYKCIKLLNGIDFWGGSGAIWEVYIANEEDDIKFKKEIIFLINLMKKTKILGRGVKPIKRLFEEDLLKVTNK
jgi:hypothetical protein